MDAKHIGPGDSNDSVRSGVGEKATDDSYASVASPGNVNNLLQGTAPRELWRALGVLVAGMALTVFAALYVKDDIARAAQREFDFTCNEIRLNIDARLAACAQLLHGGAAFFDASESVDRENWKVFNQGLQLEQQLPGIQGVGFSLWIPAEQLARHVEEIRGQGFPDYQVKPAGERTAYSSIIYLEPFSKRNLRAFGYDMYSEPVRRAAMERGRDDNTVALSGKVLLMQETDKDVQAGTLMYVPVYRHGLPIATIEQRRAALQGWVYSPYRMTDMMTGTLRVWNEMQQDTRICLQVYDGDGATEDGLLYDSRSAADRSQASTARLARQIRTEFGGRTWTLCFTQLPERHFTLGYGIIWLILISGTCVSLLLSLLWFSLLNTRLKARQLEKMGRLLAEAQKIAHLGSWEYAAATHETAWSDEEFRIYGLEPGARSPNYAVMLAESIHPDDRSLLNYAFQTCLESGSIFEMEHGILRPDGSVRIVYDLAHPYCDASGKVVRYVGTTLDITERKRAEEALRESTSMLSRSQEIAHVGSWHLELANNHLTWSDETYRIFGMAPQEFAATYEAFLAIVHPEDRAAVDAAYADSLREGNDSYESEHRVVRPRTGEVRHVLERCAHVRDATGAIVRSVGIVQDITERKRAEEENLALERQVQHAQKLESLGVLAGGIAHDFNNLLMAILGNAGLALHELSPMSPARDNIQEIEKASKRAAELAKQMLAYSGKGHFVIEPINAGTLIEEMAHLLEVSIAKNAVIKYNLARNLPTFDGDATQIRQIIMNLITNASEAVGEKSGVIALSTGAMHCDRAYLDGVSGNSRAVPEAPLPEGVYTYFEVADTGCGMDAATVAKIFDPFFTTKFTGRGLGMSAVLGIVRGHRGTFNIYSEVGKGTTFKVLFPANKLPENGFPIRRPDEAAEIDWRGSGTILIADDEESVCAVGQQILGHMGFHVLTASHGREALERFREHADEIVCVLLDLTMPHMDGEETFREMRRLRPGVKVLLCSGYNEQDTIERFSGKGLAGFLQKPYSMGELRDKLRAILTG